MRHLCSSCSSLTVGEEIDGKRLIKSANYAAYSSVKDMADSAERKDGKPCHFCALLLRSLKDHRFLGTKEEESHLPSGPVRLFLSDANDELTVLAECDTRRGSPIQLSLGTDESCRGSDVSSSACSDQVFSQIQSWCHDCVNKHPRCSIAKSSVSWLPSRVIDLGPKDGPITPKLLESRGAVGQYVTLTHRWTEMTRPSATTQANYEARKKSIDMSSLSLTFQDAFECSRRLGIRYLWIDALCIIQDSPEDWEREASNMRSIYEFAWLNVAVAGSEEKDGRLFMRRISRISRPCKMPESLLSGYSGTLRGPIYVYLSSQCYAKAVFDGFLTRRGWILQERILSPRTIYFGQEEVFWECSSVTASETIPWGWTDNASPLVKFNSHDLALSSGTLIDDDLNHIRQQPESPRKIRKLFGRFHDVEALAPLFNYWYRLVSAYTSKDLTKAGDRLPAIFGLAQALHKSGMPYNIFSECYQNGIWLIEPASLLWYLQSKPGMESNRIQGNPSYSWGSWINPASFIASEILFVDESQVLKEHVIESLGGHPATQITVINPPSEVTQELRSRSRRLENSDVLEIRGQVDIGTLRIITERPVIQPAKPVSVVASSGNATDEVFTRTMEKCDLRCELNFRDDDNRTPEVILDCDSENELRDWLELSENTVWLLKLAVGKAHPNPTSTATWILKEYPRFEHSSSGYYEFGLLLIPMTDDLTQLKEAQQKLEPWNLEASKIKFSKPWMRAQTPPFGDKTRWMHAGERMEVYKLLGPHNTTFRRIGIYRSRVGTYGYYQQHVTTVLLA